MDCTIARLRIARPFAHLDESTFICYASCSLQRWPRPRWCYCAGTYSSLGSNCGPPLFRFLPPSCWPPGSLECGGMLATVFGTVVVARLFGQTTSLSIFRRVFSDHGDLCTSAVCLSWLVENTRASRQRMARRQSQLEAEIGERKRAEAAQREHREQLAVEIERRNAAEAALREREERVRMAVESAAIGTWDFNPLAANAIGRRTPR